MNEHTGRSPIRTHRGVVRAVGLVIALIGLATVGIFALASTPPLAARVAAVAQTREIVENSNAEVKQTSADASTPQATSAALCPAGQIPGLSISAFPATDHGGAATPEAAVLRAAPASRILDLRRVGLRPEAPAWIVTDRGTFIATILSDGTWFAAPATLIDCHTP